MEEECYGPDPIVEDEIFKDYDEERRGTGRGRGSMDWDPDPLSGSNSSENYSEEDTALERLAKPGDLSEHVQESQKSSKESAKEPELRESEVDYILKKHLKEDLLVCPGAQETLHLKGPPPKLPRPLLELNYSKSRNCLLELLRYHFSQISLFLGNPKFKPSWWPNHVLEWTCIQNIHHRQQKSITNNCLRIVIAQGYFYYGYDANTYVKSPESKFIKEAKDALPVISDVRTTSKKSMPDLRLIPDLRLKQSNTPPITESTKEIYIQSLLMSLKPMPIHRFRAKGHHPLIEFMHQDYLQRKRYTDTVLVSSSGHRFKVHGLILRLLSPQLNALLTDLPEQSMHYILFPDIPSSVLKLLIHALYTGEVRLRSKTILEEVLKAKDLLSEVGLLQDFKVEPLTPSECSDNVESIDFSLSKDKRTSKEKKDPQPQVRKSLRVRRKKKLPDFDLGGDSDIESPFPSPIPSPVPSLPPSSISSPVMSRLPSPLPIPVIKKEPIYDDEEIAEKIDIDLPIIKLEKPDEVATTSSPSPVQRSSRSLKRPQILPPPRKPVLIPLKRHRPNAEAQIKGLTIKTLDTTFKEGGAKALSSLLMKKGFLSEKPPKCSSCGNHTSLQSDSQAEDGLLWRCSNSKHFDISLRTNSIFEGSSESLHWIMKIIICWNESINLSQCHQLYGGELDRIMLWYDKCKGFFGSSP